MTVSSTTSCSISGNSARSAPCGVTTPPTWATGRTLEIIAHCAAHRVPLLGVCLGHQALGQHFGADVVRADEICHGKTSPVTHDGSGVLAGIPSPFTVARYHSLTVDPATVPEDLVITAQVASGMIMAMRHKDLPLHSVQFHPESVMTGNGHRILANWLADAGRAVEEAELERLAERHAATLAGATAAVN